MRPREQAQGRAKQAIAPIAAMRRSPIFLKATASILIVAFLGLTLQPLAIAAQLPGKTPNTAAAPSNEEKLSQHLEAIEGKLERLDEKLAKKKDASQEKTELKTLRQELDTLDTQALQDFNEIERHLKEKKLPQVILDRHYEAVKHYKAEMATLKANLDDIEQEADDDRKAPKAKKAKEHLKAKQKKKGPKTEFDPNDLPHKALKPNEKNKPRLRKEDFERAGLYDNPRVQLAAHGTYTFNRLPGANDPAYLAETVEVVLTQAIKDKAAELQHNPVLIYNWVRNNIEWLPTFGATQDSDITLGSKRGNALDIASLLIALLRASGIPSRYVHGTIDVAPDKFMNWAGGFTNINAAMEFASAGSVPITGIVSGGRIAQVRMEHVWVEAAIDFFPSRGAVNKDADTWVALDAAYKQYEYLKGLDVIMISGLDPASVAQSFAASGTVNQQEGWVQGLNPAILTNAQTQAQTALQTYIQNNIANPTVGDVIGGRKIIQQTSRVLPTGLPYQRILTGARYGTIPPALQHTMTFAFGRDILGDPIDPISFPWARVNNHKVTLSFKPASPADEQALASLLPPGPITDPSQLPSSIPSYLVYVVPEISVNGQVVKAGSAMRLGEDLELVFQVALLNQSPIVKTYKVAAGAYLSLGAIRGSVSSKALQELRTSLAQTKAKLESGNANIIGTLSRENILGDMFHAGTLGYWGQYIALADTASLPQGAKHNLAAGFGSLGYEPNVNYFFGFPRAITPGGVAVNVWVADANADAGGNGERRKIFQIQSGLLSSALEHAVPEQMFSTATQQAQGVSAVKALQIAASQGQRIYHITPQNQAQVLPNLRLDGAALSEINTALATGREVIAHTDRISVPGWTGEGYILFDPDTGHGAYKITGGTNGSYLALALSILLAAIALIPQVAVYFFPLSIFIFTLVVTVLTFANVLNSLQGCGGSIGVGMALIASLLAALPGEGATVIRVFIEGFILEEGFTSAENAACGLM